MKTQPMPILLLCFNLVIASTASAQFGGHAQITSTSDAFNRAAASTATSTTTTSTTKGETIQDLAKATELSNQRGSKIASTLTSLAMVGVAVSCYKASPKCKWWVAGLVATYLMARNMSKAKGQSGLAYQAVTVEDPDTKIKNPNATTPESTNSELVTRMDGADSTPDLKRAKEAIDKLKKDGWKIDEKKATITTPKGEKVSMRSLNSPSAMAQAGAPASFIQEFSNLPKAAAKKVDEQMAKSADAGESAYGNDLGGSGGGSAPAVSATADGASGLYGMPTEGGQAHAGIDRNPAQVAGMTKDYNGEKIGVSADSLFHMIDRRYELHQKRGSFLAP